MSALVQERCLQTHYLNTTTLVAQSLDQAPLTPGGYLLTNSRPKVVVFLRMQDAPVSSHSESSGWVSINIGYKEVITIDVKSLGYMYSYNL